MIAMPNPDSIQFGLLVKRWVHVDAPHHLFLIPLSALRDRLRERGVSLVGVTSDDPSGRCWNAFVREYPLRWHPHVRITKRLMHLLAEMETLVMRPFEGCVLAGTACAAVFVKDRSFP